MKHSSCQFPTPGWLAEPQDWLDPRPLVGRLSGRSAGEPALRLSCTSGKWARACSVELWGGSRRGRARFRAQGSPDGSFHSQQQSKTKPGSGCR